MKDLFSQHAAEYANYRPSYPKELYQHLFSLAPSWERAWDVASGNGQVARELASGFARVDATDISAEQLQQAPGLSNVYDQVCPAERTSFEAKSFDLIVVAQALHWFDIDAFHEEARRVAKDGAAIVEIGYGRLQCEEEEIDKLIDRFYRETVGPYWDPERIHIDREYEDLAFPFSGLERKRFLIHVRWSAERTAAYLRTWSSVQRYLAKEGKDPVEELEASLKELAGEEGLSFRFPVFLRSGSIR
jgi:SAM-dependent methyltransferase